MSQYTNIDFQLDYPTGSSGRAEGRAITDTMRSSPNHSLQATGAHRVTRSVCPPSCSTPMSSSTQPDRKHSTTASSGGRSWRFSRVRMAAMAVGPTGESLQEPNTAYTKQAMKEEYSPYWNNQSEESLQ